MIASLVTLGVAVLFLTFLWKKVLPLFRGHATRNSKLIRSQSRARRP